MNATQIKINKSKSVSVDGFVFGGDDVFGCQNTQRWENARYYFSHFDVVKTHHVHWNHWRRLCRRRRLDSKTLLAECVLTLICCFISIYTHDHHLSKARKRQTKCKAKRSKAETDVREWTTKRCHLMPNAHFFSVQSIFISLLAFSSFHFPSGWNSLDGCAHRFFRFVCSLSDGVLHPNNNEKSEITNISRLCIIQSTA